MAYEILVGLNVLDEDLYTQYRMAMKPFLTSFGGGFGYDFTIAEVLSSEVTEKINRVFTINFPNKKGMESFFSNEEYLKIKEQFFIKSVGNTTIISSYEK
ncbi:MAG: hypothetical protein ACI9LM_001894 [Alteromonadaceae bacterium]|jgi:uncharacterized protein (DUF1330 family)